MADKLAKEAIKLTIPKIILPITLEEIKIMARNISLKNWQSRWNFFDHEIARKFYPTIPTGKITTEKRLNNKDFGTLYKVISGHGLFGKHLSKWRKDISDTCQLCSKKKRPHGISGMNVRLWTNKERKLIT